MLPLLASKDPFKGIPGSTDAWGRDRMIDMARHMDVAMAGLSPSTWRLFSNLKQKLRFFMFNILQVDFYPEGRGYSGVFSGRDNYYPRDDYFYGGGYRYILSTHHLSRFVFSWSILAKTKR